MTLPPPQTTLTDTLFPYTTLFRVALEQLRGEVALVRLAVEVLASARESIEIPDYQPTLANTEKILLALTQRVDVIAKSPAITLTPETMGERVHASVARSAGELPM